MTGNDLKAWREEIGFSQETLARVLEVSVSTVARWEQLKEKEIPNSKMLTFALKGIESERKERSEKNLIKSL